MQPEPRRVTQSHLANQKMPSMARGPTRHTSHCSGVLSGCLVHCPPVQETLAMMTRKGLEKLEKQTEHRGRSASQIIDVTMTTAKMTTPRMW